MAFAPLIQRKPGGKAVGRGPSSIPSAPGARQPPRCSSAAGFRASEPAGTCASWGFSATPESPQDERCPAATPVGSPTQITPIKTEAPARATSEAKPATLTGAGMPAGPRAALETLAGQLGAAARGAAVAQSVGGTWEEAFLAGVAVGLQLPSAARKQSAGQRALLAVVLVCGLVVLAGSALLLGGFTHSHPQAVYYM